MPTVTIAVPKKKCLLKLFGRVVALKPLTKESPERLRKAGVTSVSRRHSHKREQRTNSTEKHLVLCLPRDAVFLRRGAMQLVSVSHHRKNQNRIKIRKRKNNK